MTSDGIPDRDGNSAFLLWQEDESWKEKVRCSNHSKSGKKTAGGQALALPINLQEDFHPTSASVISDTSISCTTFNILAPIYKRIGGESCRESHFHEAWLSRNQRILDMLLIIGSSIICLQEFWLENEELVHLYEDSLGCAGYTTYKLARTNNRGDGLLTAIKTDRLKVLSYRELSFYDCGDRVAQFFHLRLKFPFYKRNHEQELLLVNTHLLFPHDSSFCHIRLRQVHKIMECLEHFETENGVSSVPVILSGDWNGSKRGHVYKFLRSKGFVSSYDTVHSYTDNDAHRWISHRNHRGNLCGVDFIWLRNPSVQKKSTSANWREGVLGTIKAKFCEAGLSDVDALGFFERSEDNALSNLYEFERKLLQLGLTQEHSASFAREEIKDLMLALFANASNLTDPAVELKGIVSMEKGLANSFPKSNDFMNFAGFAIRDAFLFPQEVEQGFWPEDYSLSDHAPLTAVFEPTKVFN